MERLGPCLQELCNVVLDGSRVREVQVLPENVREQPEVTLDLVEVLLS